MYDTGYSGCNELKQITSLGTSHFIKRLFATVFSLSYSFSFTLSLPLRQHNCSSTEGFIQGFNYWTWDQFCWIFGEPSWVPGEKKTKKKNGAQCVPRSKTGLGRPKITNVSFRNTCYCSQRSQWFGTLGRRWDFPDSPDVLPPATTVVALAIRSRLWSVTWSLLLLSLPAFVTDLHPC